MRSRCKPPATTARITFTARLALTRPWCGSQANALWAIAGRQVPCGVEIQRCTRFEDCRACIGAQEIDDIAGRAVQGDRVQAGVLCRPGPVPRGHVGWGEDNAAHGEERFGICDHVVSSLLGWLPVGIIPFSLTRGKTASAPPNRCAHWPMGLLYRASFDRMRSATGRSGPAGTRVPGRPGGG
jgi:hypothetical protein